MNESKCYENSELVYDQDMIVFAKYVVSYNASKKQRIFKIEGDGGDYMLKFGGKTFGTTKKSTSLFSKMYQFSFSIYTKC